jgi:hypothetical protein
VTGHGRKFGKKDSHPLPFWNGGFEHYERIGDALWEFLWCIDAITNEKDGIGLVLGGTPVKLQRIVSDLKGADKETVRRHLKRLADRQYIRVRRTPYGQVIEVLNSKKFKIWKKEKPQNAVSEKHIHESEKHIHEREKLQNAVSKEDSAVTQHKDAAVRGASPTIWETAEIAPSSVPAEFRELCEGFWAKRNGTPIFELMGLCLDGWKALGNDKYPRAFSAAKAKFKNQASPNTTNSPQLEELEALPWKK